MYGSCNSDISPVTSKDLCLVINIHVFLNETFKRAARPKVSNQKHHQPVCGQRSNVFWLNDVLQGKFAHQRIDVYQEKRFFFTLLTSTELWVLQVIHFLHQYSSFF